MSRTNDSENSRDPRDPPGPESASGAGPTDAPEDLITFMQRSPLADAIAAGEFTLPERSTDPGRDIDLS